MTLKDNNTILLNAHYLTNSFFFKTLSPNYISHIKTLSIAIYCLFNDLNLYIYLSLTN